MASFWRKPFMAAVYGFGIALVLTVAAGSVVGWSSSAATKEASAQAAAADTRAAAADERARAAEAELVQATQQSNAGTVDPGGVQGRNGTPAPGAQQTTLAVTVKSKADGPLLATTDVAVITVSYTFSSGDAENALPLDGNGHWETPWPASAEEANTVCLKPPPKWNVVPEAEVTLVEGSTNRVACAHDVPRPKQGTGVKEIVFFLQQGP